MPMVLWRSFRVRLAVLSALMTLLLLGAFGVYALAVVQRISLARVDTEMRDIARQCLARPANAVGWQEMESRLQAVYATESGPDLVLLAIEHGPSVLYASADWPAALDAGRFPEPPEPFPRGPEDRPFRPRDAPRRGPGPPEFGGGPPPRGPGMPPLEPYGRPDRPGPPEGARPGPPVGPPPGPPRALAVFDWLEGGRRWRVGVFGTPHTTLALALDLGRYTADLRRVRNAFLLALPLALLLAACGSYVVAQGALRTVRTLTEAIERVHARGLEERIAAGGQDVEFRRLIEVYNEMLERLGRSFAQATRFSADAAHELKTPLAVLQGDLERGVQEAAAGSEEQARYSRLLDQVQRLKAITRKLLLLATADAGKLQLRLEGFKLSEAVQAACEDAAILAPELSLRKEIAPGIVVMADADLLPQVIQNLLSNAAAYNQPHGAISVHLRRQEARVLLTVANTGPGIAAGDRGRIFERFYRGDRARSRERGGTGLGLSLAREIARAHGGDLVLDSSPPGFTSFTLVLPAGARAQ